ncbi:V-type ATP synthase subunit A [Sedimentibacter hydroxybenzoicus DSM 7310]|uniref:V-type ATP synthase alpha chain n=1 Tax=Sedimentibacter hydroxybenzoicus DSM 7310 TaxID=1123245 RepID=A0A974BNJ3_SEDHY|nr:V-type ATP synthase subunit A [Sedimentibacter hydroxybenzoicus]NYB76040.1 V-type ATP synthase subunit A [Sedimentibacter hydroxybenzoicus DSM 7310]
MANIEGIVSSINGPVVKGLNMGSFKVHEMVTVGKQKLIGEVVSIEGSIATVQVYEETEGLKAGEIIYSTGTPLSVTLGPGMIGNIFDGIQRPLERIQGMSKDFIPEGIGLISIDENKKWDVTVTVKAGDKLNAGDVYATVQETHRILHKVMVPYNVKGTVTEVKNSGEYTLNDIIVVLEKDNKETVDLTLCTKWPVRRQRPIKERLPIYKPLITGQRVIDSFYPIAKGGTIGLPGGFGTGKTVTQHQLAKWSDADIIVYIGCGERGNEMTDVLEEFPKLIDPRTNRPLMERTVLIANTSNMPVAAREASIYTGITMAEYYRDMGYDVAIMADSTSRWAEALREISGRLEEMPAEEGYPAYLPSRLAEFYERAGCVKTLNGQEASITIIGAVSPPGGDFSEPVTENTKRFVTGFLALDKKLAYARHYPAINYLTSYSGYVDMLSDWYDQNVSSNLLNLRHKMIVLLQEDEKLNEIVQLVGEDVLPNDQALVLETARMIKKGFLQQNALHSEDSYVTLEKQYKMLKCIDTFYEEALQCVKIGIPISVIRKEAVIQDILKIKYDIPNDKLELLDVLNENIIKAFNDLRQKYE